MARASPTITPADLGIDETKGNAVDHAELDENAAASKDAIGDAAARGQGLTGYESLTAWQTIKAFRVNVATCGAVAFSAAMDGYQISINGNIIANRGFVAQFGTETNDDGSPALASSILSAWTACMSVGQIIGMTTLPFLSARYGRKTAMYTYWFILAMSVMAECLARSWPVWLVAKLLAGIGVGCLQSTVPTYIAEVAPNRIRGNLLMTFNFFFVLGTLFAPVTLQVLGHSYPDNWLTPVYTQWAQIGIMLLIYVCIPESPAWCVTRGKEELAKSSLRQLHRGVANYDLEQQYRLLVLAVEHEMEVARASKNEKWYSIFKGIDGKRTLTALWTLLTQQFLGLTLFSTFASYFFQQAGLASPFMVKCIIIGINIATNLVVIFIADKVGRRRISCTGSTVAWIACVGVGILGVTPSVTASNYLFVFFAIVWNMGVVCNSATGWGFIGEVSSQRLRGYTAGFGAATTCVAGVVMNVLTPFMVNTNQWDWGLKAGWFYAGIGLPCVVVMWLLIPETGGRSAAELDELFERKIKPWRFHKTETATQRVLELRQEN